jgi:nucleotide-binding universal stress UspA family protein
MRALQAAYLLAPEAEFLVLHAWDTPLMGFGTSDPAERAVARENQRVRDLVARRSKELLSLLSPHATAPRFELIEGSPYAAIRNQISMFNPDILAMGTHARSALTSAVTGSLSREFLVEATCDVLVVRP